MALQKNLFVFDIETVPDPVVGRNLLGCDSSVSDQEVIDQLKQYHLDITAQKNDFLRQPFWKVVAISFVEAEIVSNNDGTENYIIKDIRSGGTEDSTEEELLKGFFSHLGRAPNRLVSFNGKTFDLPVLKYRAMRYGIQAKWLHNKSDKWNNYSTKFSLDWHCDLIDAFSDYGSSARVKMKEVCALLNIPGKLDVDGSQVSNLFNDGKIQEIRDYCELDVINTYLLYLHYMHHTGAMNNADFEDAQIGLEEYLDMHSDKKENFRLFLEELNLLRAA